MSNQPNDNDVVEVDGIRFETLVPEFSLTVPEVSAREKIGYHLKFFFHIALSSPLPFVPVQMGIRITNNTEIPLRFNLFGTLIPQLIRTDGQLIKGYCYCRKLLRPKELDFPLLLPGKSIIFFPYAELSWSNNNQFSLKIHAGDGSIWSFRGLKLESYLIQFTFENLESSKKISTGEDKGIIIEDIWTGKGFLPWVEFCLTNIR